MAPTAGSASPRSGSPHWRVSRRRWAARSRRPGARPRSRRPDRAPDQPVRRPCTGRPPVPVRGAHPPRPAHGQHAESPNCTVPCGGQSAMTNTSRLAIDVGGTFTDVVELVPETGGLRFDKVPTTPQAPTPGVMNAFAAATVGVGEVAMFTHGTTLGLNALLTRTGARAAVIATKGFRDVYLLGRTDRRSNYDITYRKPAPLLERHDTFEVGERSLFDGSVHRPLDLEAARRGAAGGAGRGGRAGAGAGRRAGAGPGRGRRGRGGRAGGAPDGAGARAHERAREGREDERTSTA